MNFSTLNAKDTLALGHTITTVLAGEGAGDYGIPTSVVTALSGLDGSLSSLIDEQALLAGQAKANTVAKAAQRDIVAAHIASIHATVLNNPAVTDDMIVALGLTPRRGGGRPEPRVVTMVTGVVAEPAGGTSIRVSWDRGTNSVRTIFVLESSSNNTDFSPVKALTRVTYVVPDCPPGEPIFFRVTATSSTASSQPSQSVGVYTPGIPATPVLKLAA